jgi:hypothetical protein
VLRHLGRVFDILHPGDMVGSPFPVMLTHASASSYSGGSVPFQPSDYVGPPPRFKLPIQFDQFIEAFARLSSANDVADELLQRYASRGMYAPWDEREGKKARWDWRKDHGDPLKPLRTYRNRLVHGRVPPGIERPRWVVMYPRADKVGDYLDWRPALDPATQHKALADFDSATSIVSKAWTRVVEYVETRWADHLV